jgi:hypothetical protein
MDVKQGKDLPNGLQLLPLRPINAGITRNPGKKRNAGSVRFAASGNFPHHEVDAIENRHWQLARQAEQQPFLDDLFEFVPAFL